MCHTVALSPDGMTLPVVFHKVPYWDHSCSSSIQTIYQTRCLTHSAYYLPMIREYITPIKNDLNVLAQWFYANKLSLNVQQMKLIGFRPKHSGTDEDVRISTKMCAHHITSITSVKFLGIYIYIYIYIYIDDGLEWMEHINHVVKRISSRSYAIHFARRFRSTDNLRLLYHSLVHSHLSYGTILWGAAYQYKLYRLEIIKKRCIRNVCNAS